MPKNAPIKDLCKNAPINDWSNPAPSSNYQHCVPARLLTGPPLGEGEGWSLLEGRGVSEPDKQVNYCKDSL